MTPKYKPGQRVELLPGPRIPTMYKHFQGAHTTIVDIAEPPLSIRRRWPDRVYYTVALRTPRGNFLKVSEPYLRPIDDPNTALGSWDEIERLLGTDIRKEREVV